MEDFSTIVHPISKKRISIFSSSGRNLLKSYIQAYKLGGSRIPIRYSERWEEMEDMAERARRAEEAAFKEMRAREETKARSEWMRKNCDQELRELEQAREDAKSWMSYDAWKAWFRGKDTDDVTTKMKNYRKCEESQMSAYNKSRPGIPKKIADARHEAELREWGIDPFTMQRIPETQEELERMSARLERLRKEEEK